MGTHFSKRLNLSTVIDLLVSYSTSIEVTITRELSSKKVDEAFVSSSDEENDTTWGYAKSHDGWVILFDADARHVNVIKRSGDSAPYDSFWGEHNIGKKWTLKRGDKLPSGKYIQTKVDLNDSKNVRPCRRRRLGASPVLAALMEEIKQAC